jgi:hypothetical protein
VHDVRTKRVTAHRRLHGLDAGDAGAQLLEHLAITGVVAGHGRRRLKVRIASGRIRGE